MPTCATTGLSAASLRTASKIASPPAVVPPGESIDRMTPLTAADLRDRLEPLEQLLVLGDRALDPDLGDVVGRRAAETRRRTAQRRCDDDGHRGDQRAPRRARR